MQKKWALFGTILLICLAVTTPVIAQTPRPTPTNVANSVTSEQRGRIFGTVYTDMNGDGRCVDTGVEGEGPLAGVKLQFTSSDGDTVLSLSSGENGTYGLVAAGESHWEVLVVPEHGQVVTSQNPIYVPVYASDTLEHTGINFCVADAANAVIVLHGRYGETIHAPNAVVLAPEAGAAAPQPAGVSIVFMSAIGVGLTFLLFGLLLEWRRLKK